MVRYIGKNELYHFGVKGQVKGVRRYQYPDGTYTPLGREHYGIGTRKDRTVGEEIVDKAKAVRGTLAGYGLIRYKETVKRVGPDRAAKARLSRQEKADKKRAEEAYKKRQELKAAAKAEKERVKEEYRKIQAEREAKVQEQGRKNAEENKRRREEYDAHIRKVTEEADNKLAEIREKENFDKAKSGKFEDFSNEDLKRYTERIKLEAEANRVEWEAKLKRLDTPRMIAEELINYGKTGVSAYKAYKDVKASIDEWGKSKLPKEETVQQKMAKDLMEQITSDYDEKKFMKDPNAAADYKDDIYRRQQMIEAVGKVYEMTRDDYKGNSGGKDNIKQIGAKKENNKDNDQQSNNNDKKGDKQKDNNQPKNNDKKSDKQKDNNQSKSNDKKSDKPKDNKQDSVSTSELKSMVGDVLKKYSGDWNSKPSSEAMDNQINSLVNYIKGNSNNGQILSEEDVWNFIDRVTKN